MAPRIDATGHYPYDKIRLTDALSDKARELRASQKFVKIQEMQQSLHHQVLNLDIKADDVVGAPQATATYTTVRPCRLNSHAKSLQRYLRASQ